MPRMPVEAEPAEITGSQTPSAERYFRITHERSHGTLDRRMPTRTPRPDPCLEPAVYLRRVLRDYETHHDTHRPHMALAGAAQDKPLPPEIVDLDLDAFHAQKHHRVGSMIREYHRAA